MPAPPIVVGIDGSPSALDAVRWATAEAVSRHVALHIVSAALLTPDSFVHSIDRRAIVFGARENETRHALATAMDHALRCAAPAPLSARTEFVYGPAAAALTERSASALMVVVGSRGHGGVHQRSRRVPRNHGRHQVGLRRSGAARHRHRCRPCLEPRGPRYCQRSARGISEPPGHPGGRRGRHGREPGRFPGRLSERAGATSRRARQPRSGTGPRCTRCSDDRHGYPRSWWVRRTAARVDEPRGHPPRSPPRRDSSE